MSEQVDFTNLYAVYAGYKGRRKQDVDAAAVGAEAEEALTGGEAILRGAYSTVGFRAETDLMFWLIGPTADSLQDALVRLSRTELGRCLDPWWTSIGVHREAEFNKGHIPSYLKGGDPLKYLCVYPFVRSYEWYLLDPEERSAMLREHGMMAAGFEDVRPNTISAFSLNDYEWLLAFESDRLERIVDLMRQLRGAKARRHTREELPFLTGIRKSLADVVMDLPPTQELD